MWINSMDNHGVAGVSQNAGVPFVLVKFHSNWSIRNIIMEHGDLLRSQDKSSLQTLNIMTSYHGNAFCITDPLWEESTNHQWFSLPIIWSLDISFIAVEQAIDQAVKMLVILDAIMPRWRHCNYIPLVVSCHYEKAVHYLLWAFLRYPGNLKHLCDSLENLISWWHLYVACSTQLEIGSLNNNH